MNIRSLCQSAVVVLPLLVVAAASCKDDNSGALMLAMSTDLSVPDDVTAVGLQIESDGRPLVNLTQLVLKTSDGNIVRLPATFAVTPAEDAKANPKIRVRVVAYSGQTPIVLRQAISTVPRGRIGLLRMPLLFANKTTLTVASAVSASSNRGLGMLTRAEDLPSEISDACGRDETLIGGVCKDANVDSSTLPTCATETCDDLVFSAASGSKKCMSIAACFFESDRVKSWKLPVEDAATRGDDACTVALPAAYRETRDPRNFVLSVPDNTGSCASDKMVDGKRSRSDCYVAVRPSTAAGAEGYIDHSDGTYGMPSWICTQRKAGRSVQVTIGCDSEFSEGVELCPVDRPADLTPIKFTKTETRPSMIPDAGPRKTAMGDGRLFLPESPPEQLLVPQNDSNLYVLAKDQKVVRASILNIDCSPADGGASLPMPALTSYPGTGLGNNAVFDVPRIIRSPFSILQLPLSTADRADTIGLVRLKDDGSPAFRLDGLTWAIRGIGMAYTNDIMATQDYVFVISQTQAGATSLMRRQHNANTAFSNLDASTATSMYGAFTGAVAGVGDTLYTANQSAMGATLLRLDSASFCTTGCTFATAGTITVGAGPAPTITSIVATGSAPVFFTVSVPGTTTTEIYSSLGNAGSAATRIAKGLELEGRGVYAAPPQIAVDGQCVYAIRKAATVGEGMSTHEIICIKHKDDPDMNGDYPIEVLARANNFPRGLATYQSAERVTVFWGESTLAGTFPGQVRCISRDLR